MSKFQRFLAIIVFIFFEVYCGVRLLTAPVDFSNSAVVTFGIVMLLVGAISLWWAISLKNMMLPNTLAMVCAIFDLVIGIVFVAFPGKVVNAFPALAKIYGVIMGIMGISKLRDYIVLQAWGLPRRVLWLIGAILTIVLGVVVFMYPYQAVEASWMYAGYFLVFTGAVDLFVFLLSSFLAGTAK